MALGILFFSTATMTDQLFLDSQNTVSGRTAIMEDDGQVAYLYLTAPSTMQIERDVILYMRVEPISQAEWKKIMQAQSTPLLTVDIASSTAVIRDPAESEFEFKWSQDGNAAAVLYRGAPLAFTSTAESMGYSKAVVANSPLAYLWDQGKYDAGFNR